MFSFAVAYYFRDSYINRIHKCCCVIFVKYVIIFKDKICPGAKVIARSYLSIGGESMAPRVFFYLKKRFRK
jgi:hypothetical protein